MCAQNSQTLRKVALVVTHILSGNFFRQGVETNQNMAGLIVQQPYSILDSFLVAFPSVTSQKQSHPIPNISFFSTGPQAVQKVHNATELAHSSVGLARGSSK